jgi:hypothetical protein
VAIDTILNPHGSLLTSHKDRLPLVCSLLISPSCFDAYRKTRVVMVQRAGEPTLHTALVSWLSFRLSRMASLALTMRSMHEVHKTNVK